MLNRCANLGLHLSDAIDKGLLTVQQIDPAELSPGEFSSAVMQRSTAARVWSSSTA
jgi:circadian clock protein KaiC